MPNKETARASLINLIYDKHKQGVLTWTKRESEDSYECNLEGNLSINLDKRTTSHGHTYYMIWAFNGSDIVDNIDAEDDITNISPPDQFSSYNDLAQHIYQSIDDRDVVSGLEIFLNALKRK